MNCLCTKNISCLGMMHACSAFIYYLVLHLPKSYCKFRNFRENFIFAKRVKRHICHGKNLQLLHGLHTSVKVKEVLLFQGFIFV